MHLCHKTPMCCFIGLWVVVLLQRWLGGKYACKGSTWKFLYLPPCFLDGRSFRVNKGCQPTCVKLHLELKKPAGLMCMPHPFIFIWYCLRLQRWDGSGFCSSFASLTAVFVVKGRKGNQRDTGMPLDRCIPQRANKTSKGTGTHANMWGSWTFSILNKLLRRLPVIMRNLASTDYRWTPAWAPSKTPPVCLCTTLHHQEPATQSQ